MPAIAVRLSVYGSTQGASSPLALRASPLVNPGWPSICGYVGNLISSLPSLLRGSASCAWRASACCLLRLDGITGAAEGLVLVLVLVLGLAWIRLGNGRTTAGDTFVYERRVKTLLHP